MILLTPTGYPPPNTAAGMAHSTHSTQPALCGHTALPPGQKTYSPGLTIYWPRSHFSTPRCIKRYGTWPLQLIKPFTAPLCFVLNLRDVNRHLAAPDPTCDALPEAGDNTAWPSQDILLLRFVCARINRPFVPPADLHCPHCCNTIIARLLESIRPPFDLPCICHTHTPYNIGNDNIV